MKQLTPQVIWQLPSKTPEVPKGENHLFWIAVQSQWSAGEQPRTLVYLANYINKPLELDDDGEPLDDDCHVNTDGDPISAIGWHNQYDHPDFSGYYEPIQFNEQLKLLGWAEYLPPEWNGEAAV